MKEQGNMFAAEVTLKAGSESAVKMRETGWSVGDFSHTINGGMTITDAKDCFAVLVDDTDGDTWRFYKMPKVTL